MQSLQRLFVPKDRVVKAELQLEIQQLCDVPLISGTYFTRWNIRDTSGARDHGATERAPIHDHRVTWNSTVTGTYSLVIAKDGMLMPCTLRLRVCHALVGGLDTETIGVLRLNLAEYVGLARASRHYLLQDSKVNATLVLSISLRQTYGDIVYKTQINVDLTGIIKDHRQNHQRHMSGGQDSMSAPENLRRSLEMARGDSSSSYSTIPAEDASDTHNRDTGASGGMTLSRAINQHARSFSRLTAMQLARPANADEPSAFEVIDAILAKSRRVPPRETSDSSFAAMMEVAAERERYAAAEDVTSSPY
ncbi:N-terminal C2 in EEIG1 and EHBP1 proteins-domain-containing protein [Thamnocephalis sphaerospora]|uniref:N-terminal C2 in EEIG1 and EHBP1 proteins-domain-containing protein n=1 Tax=Thamnocephalis sphaerospora TaxID=78915 RepID=A0A4P9XTV5_9FUNG|nr:N-terminal C2 in EEIG1 and EHBP1 proteins-domain-containing protein [Thamnocephalis sphaerospora]|eukprot:RKP09617.1 N-terminal C2 in EEIG1 and EHBP1 proteins-domain-containing protein [Thamnocephalis sphaerospora]